jgi:hypothetical protein
MFILSLLQVFAILVTHSEYIAVIVESSRVIDLLNGQRIRASHLITGCATLRTIYMFNDIAKHPLLMSDEDA